MVACGLFYFEVVIAGSRHSAKQLANILHRVRMCDLATRSSKWVSVDSWEAMQPEYVPTAKVLDRVEHEINTVLGGVEDVHGKPTKVQIALLAGADLIQR